MNNNIIKFQLPFTDSEYKVNPEAFDATLKSEYRNGRDVTLTFDAPVTTIGSYAVEVKGCIIPDPLTSLELPDSVESINGRSFGHISPKKIKFHLLDENGLVISNGILMAIFAYHPEKIIIPEGVTSIGTHVIDRHHKALECEVVFPKSLRRIEHHAFDGCLCKYKLNQGLEYVGEAALRGLQNKTLTIPTSVKHIDDYGFAQAPVAKKIVIKHKIKHIGRGAFGSSPTKLKKVEGVYASEDGLMLINDDILLRGVTNQDSRITIPAEIRIIDELSMTFCKAPISLPDGLVEIRSGAFGGSCKNWYGGRELHIPESVERIEDKAFVNAYFSNVSGKYTTPDGNYVIVNGRLVYASPNVKNRVDIPEGTESIAPYAFMLQTVLNFDNCFPQCFNILNLPASIKSIDKLAFGWGREPQPINIYTIIINSVTPFDWNMECITQKANIFVPDESVEAFRVAYPDRASMIKGKSEFKDTVDVEVDNIRFTYQGTTLTCIQSDYTIEEIEIPEQTEEIADNLKIQVIKKSDIKKITFPESLRRIGNSAFKHCEKLQSVTFPESLRRIGNSAFEYCDKLRSVKFPDNLQEIGDKCFAHCGLRSLIIPNGVKSIGKEAFHSNNMKKVKLGKGLEHIGENTFSQCYNLKSIEGKFTSNNGKMLVCDGILIWASCEDGEDLIIPEGVVKLPEWCFISRSINRMVIPDSVREIPKYFYRYSVNTLVLPQSIEVIAPEFLEEAKIGKFEGKFAALDGRLLINGNQLLGVARKDFQEDDTIVIPDYVEVIGERAFHGRYNFKCGLIVLPPRLKRIEKEAFWVGRNYKITNFPETLEYIGEKAFNDCSVEIFEKSKVVIPAGVKEIGDYAFDTKYLVDIWVLPKTVPKLGILPFCGIKNIHVPIKSVGNYTEALKDDLEGRYGGGGKVIGDIKD